MSAKTWCQVMCWAILGVMMAGCASAPPYDYTNFRQHPPRSILVLPPLNQSTAVEGTYGYLSAVTMPLAELGYYVFPVAVVDQFLKENGMPTAGEMHQVPLSKVSEIIGADAVLFLTLEAYGTKYVLVSSQTTVRARGKLVDTRTGITLWEGVGMAQKASGGTGSVLGDIIAAAITQVVESSTDEAHRLCDEANANLLMRANHGLLYGPYHPKYTSGQ